MTDPRIGPKMAISTTLKIIPLKRFETFFCEDHAFLFKGNRPSTEREAITWNENSWHLCGVVSSNWHHIPLRNVASLCRKRGRLH